MYSTTFIEFGFLHEVMNYQTSCLCYLLWPSALTENSNLRNTNSWYCTQTHPIVFYYLVLNQSQPMPDDRINATLWSVFINWWQQPKEEEGLIRIATLPKPNSTIDLFLFESTKRKHEISKTFEVSFFSRGIFFRSIGQSKPWVWIL